MEDNLELPSKTIIYNFTNFEYTHDGESEKCKAFGPDYQLATINSSKGLRGYAKMISAQDQDQKPLPDNDCPLIHGLLRWACQNKKPMCYINQEGNP